MAHSTDHLTIHPTIHPTDPPTTGKPATAVAVVGSGIAGCCTAWQLAGAGFTVHLYDKSPQIAGGASGNSRAVLFARTAAERSMLSDLHEAAYHYALQFYQSLSQDTGNLTNGLSGMAKLGEQLPASLQHGELASRQPVSKDELAQHAGLPTREGGILYSQSGHIEPAKICHTLLDHPAISLHLNTAINEVKQSSEGWTLSDGTDHPGHYSAVVLCCGYTTSQHPVANWLPIKPIRGQTTSVAANSISQRLAITLCDQGYLTPGENGTHECGATFNLDCLDSKLRQSDHQANLDNANASFDGVSGQAQPLLQSNSINTGRTGFRATSPDYLPMAGPVASPPVFYEQYRALSRNARLTPSDRSKLLPGLYVNTAYGSHGFTLAPLVSLILTAYISGRPFPVGENLRQAVSPSRFLLRSVIRNQTD